MPKRNEYIELINEFKTVSPTITDQQRIGLLRRGVQQYGISISEAEDIIQSSGLIVGVKIDYFKILGISIKDIQNKNEELITSEIHSKHKELYNTSLKAGGRIRSDGKTEEQWRIILNEARDTLKNVEKRKYYIAALQADVQPVIEFLHENPPIQDADVLGESISLQPVIEDSMALIPAGEFLMGSEDIEAYNDEKPIHTVYIDDFYIDQYPVTNIEYKEFVDANPEWGKSKKWYETTRDTISIDKKYHDGDHLKNWKGNNYRRHCDYHPVTWVSWYGAMAYALWKGKRLPTEAEWEKAARGGLVGQKYPWGNSSIVKHPNSGNFFHYTNKVGQNYENGYGIYDMADNVFEWCIDLWDENYYTHSPYNNPIADGYLVDILQDFTSVITPRVIRGGSSVITPINTRVSYRHRNTPNYTSFHIGFRCVKSI
ncbi:formylglycine-generating enzyme family protein [Candidatus Poribacteria bacterium]|nr:formylglycine-generating enzyme family protein [Candidatus Poribacteria bacterium]